MEAAPSLWLCSLSDKYVWVARAFTYFVLTGPNEEFHGARWTPGRRDPPIDLKFWFARQSSSPHYFSIYLLSLRQYPRKCVTHVLPPTQQAVLSAAPLKNQSR
jgi:hypothetical protein